MTEIEVKLRLTPEHLAKLVDYLAKQPDIEDWGAIQHIDTYVDNLEQSLQQAGSTLRFRQQGTPTSTPVVTYKRKRQLTGGVAHSEEFEWVATDDLPTQAAEDLIEIFGSGNSVPYGTLVTVRHRFYMAAAENPQLQALCQHLLELDITRRFIDGATIAEVEVECEKHHADQVKAALEYLLSHLDLSYQLASTNKFSFLLNG